MHSRAAPCLFFVALYIYGKRTVQHFSEGYLGAALSLFVGSCVGFAIYTVSFSIVYGILPSLSLLYSYDAPFGVVATGVRNTLVGIAALALSHFRAKPSVTVPQVLPELAIP